MSIIEFFMWLANNIVILALFAVVIALMLFWIEMKSIAFHNRLIQKRTTTPKSTPLLKGGDMVILLDFIDEKPNGLVSSKASSSHVPRTPFGAGNHRIVELADYQGVRYVDYR